MRTGHYWRQMVRESRGSRGRLAFFVACLAVGVAAVVAVAGLTASLDDGIRRESRQLLAADLVVAGARPAPEAVMRLLASRAGVEVARLREMATVVAAPAAADGRPGRSQLVELKVVEGHYPFYGELRLDPGGTLDEALGADTAVAAPDLLARLGIAPGGDLLIGGRRFRIAAAVVAEPDRGASAFSLGPRVFLSAAGLERAGLERFGSRVQHRLLVRVPEGFGRLLLETLAAELRERAPRADGYRVETWVEAQPALREGLRRMDRFLGLVALLSLLLGGLGVAQTTRAWLDGRTDAMAILRSLGFRPREVFALYLGQAVGLGLVGSVAGIAAGLLVQRAAPELLAGLLPPDLRLEIWQPAAALRGLALGLGAALLFSLSPLLSVRRVPPLRVLRKEVEPLPASRAGRAATALALLAGITLAAAAQARSLRLGLQFTAGALAAAAVLALVSMALVRLVARLPRRRGRVWLRHGLAALARPGAGTPSAVVALGLGVLLLSGMAAVEGNLAAELSPAPSVGAPSAFLLDIQPGQWPELRQLLERRGAEEIVSVPVVTARLLEVDGRPVAELASGERGRRWALTREQRLTWLERLPDDNRIVAGELWSDPTRFELSVEEEFARDLGVVVGGELAFDLQGVPVRLAVTSLRSVDWRTFGINFFFVAEPGALDRAPHVRLATMRLPPADERETLDLLAARFPNVTALDLREMLGKVRAILRRLALAVRFLGLFTVLAGVVILAGTVSAVTVRRGREIALLKTLGMTRRSVAAMLAVEHALLGLVAGAVGCAGGQLLGWAVVTRGMELTWRLDPLPILVAVAGSALLTAVTGILAAAPALNRRPLEALNG